jgi:DNA repair protein RadC
MAITDWPEQERPRERLLKHGAAALSDAELLAIFLRVGIKGKSAVDLARQLCMHFGSLQRLFHAEPVEFAAIPGMGSAKYAQLQAVLEMAKRALHEELALRDLFAAPAAVRDWLCLKLAHLPHEAFVALWLDAQNRLIAHEELFRGTLTQTSVYPRIPPRGGQTGFVPECRRGHFRPQPPVRGRRTVARRRGPDRIAETSPGAGRRESVGSLHRRRQ